MDNIWSVSTFAASYRKISILSLICLTVPCWGKRFGNTNTNTNQHFVSHLPPALRKKILEIQIQISILSLPQCFEGKDLETQFASFSAFQLLSTVKLLNCFNWDEFCFCLSANISASSSLPLLYLADLTFTATTRTQIMPSTIPKHKNIKAIYQGSAIEADY